MSDRSPRYPAMSLDECLKFVEKFYAQAQRSALDIEVAVKALGYSGLNGASRTTMAAMGGYGAFQKASGKYRISDVALRAIRPPNESDRLAALREMALTPPAFRAIHEHHRECSQSLLATTLLHEGYTEDGAKRAAKIYKENVEFAKLAEADILPSAEPMELEGLAITPPGPVGGGAAPQRVASPPVGAAIQTTGNVLATYNIPLGANQATLVFTGNRLTTDDFDALMDFVQFSKRQFERAERAAAVTPPTITREEDDAA